MTRDLVCFTLGFVLAAVADVCDKRYRVARAEWDALRARLRP